jgi:LPS-assembly lipoprotein
MQRRTLLLLAPAWSLAGCGFQLRQAPNFAFEEIYIAMPEQSTLGTELKRQLAASGKVTLITDPKRVPDAQAVLESLVDQREKVVVALNAAGQVREFQLRIRFRFRLRGREGKPLIADTEILQQRDISFNESAVLAKEAEEALLYRDMQSDIVQQVLRRLAAVKEI